MHSRGLDPSVRRRVMLGILLWCVSTGLLRLGAEPVYIHNEAREGVYVRAMLDTGDWVLPQVSNHVENGETIPDKPPLFHWVAASAAWLRTALATSSIPTGAMVSRRFDEWSLRFPSVLGGAVMVMAITIRGRRIVGERAAVLAAASLLVSAQYVRQSQYGRVDMMMAAFVTLALLLLGEALLDGSSPALLGAAAASGLAVLAKGPIGLALPMLVAASWVGIDAMRRRSLRRASHLPWISAAAVWAAIVAPWYLAAYLHGGMAFVRSQLLVENIRQYTGANDSMPWNYYVGPWLYMSFPWNMLGILGVGLAWRTRNRRALYGATSWVVLLTFFQLSAYKRASYLLPALPVGALMCGYFLDAMLPAGVVAQVGSIVPSGWGRRAAAVGVVIAAAGLGAWVVSVPAMVPARLQMSAFDGGIAGVGFAVAIGALLLLGRSLHERRWSTAVACFWVFEAALLHGVIGTGAIVIARRCSPQPVVARLLADLPPDAPLTVVSLRDDSSLPLLFYFPDPRRIVVWPAARPVPASLPSGYYLLGPSEWAGFGRDPVSALSAEWRVLWTDEFGDRARPTHVIFAERAQEEPPPSAR